MSILEPIGLTRSGDGKRPDGLTLPTWSNGKCLIWYFTCADTLCDSYVRTASKEVDSTTEDREKKKIDKYKNLSDHYHFVPVGAETYGAFGPEGLKLLKKIGAKTREATFFLIQSQFKELTQHVSLELHLPRKASESI